MKQTLKIFKIGGNVIDDSHALQNFLADFSSLPLPKILIHGGGKLASDLSKKMGIMPNLINGRRITDEPTLDIVTMVYAGLINKKIVAQLQQNGTNAIGLSGADGNVIQSRKRDANPIDYGFVGDIEKINNALITNLLQHNLCPVFCAITHNMKGILLNTNADTITAELAISLENEYEIEVIYVFEKLGLLSNIDDENSLIPFIKTSDIFALKKDNTISGGMLPKVDNIENLLNNGIKKVYLCHPNQVKNLDTSHFRGTIFEK